MLILNIESSMDTTRKFKTKKLTDLMKPGTNEKKISVLNASKDSYLAFFKN